MQVWRYPVADASCYEEIIAFPTTTSSYARVETAPCRLDRYDSQERVHFTHLMDNLFGVRMEASIKKRRHHSEHSHRAIKL